MLPRDRLLLVLLILVWVGDSRSQNPDEDCLAYYLNIRMTCAASVERRSGISLAECKTLCLVNLDRCRTFQYDAVQRQCNVFAVDNPLLAPISSTRPPAFALSQALPLKDHPTEVASLKVKKLRSSRSIASIGTAHISEVPLDPMALPNDYCEPTMIPSIGVTFMVPKRNCRHRQIEASPRRDFGPPPNPFGPPSLASPVLPPFANLPECPDASRPLVQLIDGVEVPSQNPVAVTTVHSPDQCLLACQTRERTRDSCQSATFDRTNGECVLLDDTINPNGDLQYTPNVNVVYFEKMCINSVNSLVRCDDAAHRIPQHILVGHATEIASAPNQIECIRLCIVAQTKFGFECRSILYFFEFPEDNCILNKHTRSTRSAFFIPERRQKVDYVQLPACWTSPAWQREDVKASKTHNSPQNSAEWSRWSECDKQAHLQTRNRNCSTCVGGNREVTPCVPDKQFESEFGNLISEQEKTESGQRFIEQDQLQIVHAPISPKRVPAAEEERFSAPIKQIDAEIDALNNQKAISNFECDPVIECCPVIKENSLKPDCSRGYRIGSDHQEESCFPEHCSWNPAIGASENV